VSTYSTHQQRELDASSSRSLDRIASQPAIMVGSVPLRRPLFVPCATCPDEEWCGANDCWWNADQGEP
jgi:hypothetical protein